MEGSRSGGVSLGRRRLMAWAAGIAATAPLARFWSASAQAADGATGPTAVGTDDPQGRIDGPGRKVGNVGEVSVLLTVKPDRRDVLADTLRSGPDWAASLSSAGTIHDARVVPLPNDQALVAITFDGPWDPYIEFFQKAISGGDARFWSSFEGYPETSAEDPEAFKQWIRENQIPAAVWYSAYPQLTVKEIARQERIADGFEEMIDAVSG